MDHSSRCSSAIRALAEDLKSQARSRNYVRNGPLLLSESEKDKIQHCLEALAKDLENLSEATLQNLVETKAQGNAIHHQAEDIINKVKATGHIRLSDALVNELVSYCAINP